MNKNFKDIFAEAEVVDVAERAIPEEPAMPPNEIVAEGTVETFNDFTIEEVKPTTESFQDSYSEDRAVEEIREEVETEFKETVRDELREQLIESIRTEVRTELLESLRKELSDDLSTQLLESNKMIAGAIGRLAEKIEALQENLTIELPTPEIKMIMPSTNKRIVRNEDGEITGITDIE